MDFSTILAHPDNEEIISKLVTGITAKEISQWLKLKYSNKDQKHLCLSVRTIEEYSNANVGNLMEHLQKDIHLVKKQKKAEANGETPEMLSASLQNNKKYKERILELAEQELDIKQMIKNLVFIIQERMEQVFDRIQENPTNFKGDYVLLQYFDKLILAAEKFDKIHNQAPDQIIQHNFSIQMFDQTKAVFQEAIRKTLAALDPETSLLFIQNLNAEVSKLQMPMELLPSVAERNVDISKLKQINAKIQDVEVDE